MLLTDAPTSNTTTASDTFGVGSLIGSDITSFLLGVLSVILVWGVYESYNLRDNDTASFSLRKLTDRLGIRWKWYQYAKFLFTFIILIYLLYIASQTQKPIIVGSMLGAFPPLLIELNKSLKSSDVKLTNIRVIKYPKSWHTFGDWKADESSNNMLRVQLEMENQGRGSATDCGIKLKSDKIDNQKYHTWWSESKQTTETISPGESKMVDILWMDLESTGIYTSSPDSDIGDNHHPPDSHSMIHRPEFYDMVHRPELSTGTHSFRVYINATGKTQRDQKIPALTEAKIPDDLLELAEDWEVIKTIKQIGEEYVIRYNVNKKRKLEVSKHTDIKILEEIDEFSRDRIGAKQSETYEEALKRKFTIERQD